MVIKEYIEKSIQTKKSILEDKNLLSLVERTALLIIDSFKNGNKLLTAGNGGSAADAQHFAGELVSKFNIVRPGLPAIALTTDSSILTAISNDLGYENIFAKQIEALGNNGDTFVAISTSGTSPNIVTALKKANEKGLKTILLTGCSSNLDDTISDIIIKIPSDSVSLIQESHIMIEHIICAMVEESLFKSN